MRKPLSCGEAGGGLVAGLLAIYFLMVFPAVQFFLRGLTPYALHAYSLYFLLALLLLLAVRKISFEDLGLAWPPPVRHLVLGGLLGALPLLALPALDLALSALALDDSELFSGAALRRAEETEAMAWVLWSAVAVPVLKQAFFTGLVARYFLGRCNPALGIYLAGLVFGLAHFRLSLGLFLLGIAGAGLFRMTGTLYASILFHLGCSLAMEWLVRDYARLVTILGFLF